MPMNYVKVTLQGKENDMPTVLCYTWSVILLCASTAILVCLLFVLDILLLVSKNLSWEFIADLISNEYE